VNQVFNFFLDKINFSVKTKEGSIEKGLFFENKFEFENKIFDLTDYGNLKNQDHVEKIIENLELLYKYEILWETIEKI
jgi:hypothetical protein